MSMDSKTIIEAMPFGKFQVVPLGKEYSDHANGLYYNSANGRIISLRKRKIELIFCNVTGLPAYCTKYVVAQSDDPLCDISRIGRECEDWVFLGPFTGPAEIKKVWTAIQILMDCSGLQTHDKEVSDVQG